VSTHRPSGSAHDMVMRCFRHQFPEAYGGLPVPEFTVPPQLRYGAGEVYSQTVALSEEQVGNGAALDNTAEDAIVSERTKALTAEAQAELDRRRGFSPAPIYIGDVS
jgi:hypothetical protein